MKIEEIKSADSKKTYRFLKAVDISPKDDAFHGNINLLDIEWWYFDAVFDNGYSIHIGVRTYHIKNHGIVQSRINIYKNGKTEVELIKPNLFSNFSTSKDQPLVKINGHPVIEFDEVHYKKTREWKYHISFTIDDCGVDLTFVGTTKGWKIETSGACWTVGLPKATVDGTITIHGQTIPVKGVGYHDHNWSYSPTTVLNNLGWFWGRITADTLHITWANTIQTPKKEDLLTVINQDKNKDQNAREFYNIHPKNITFILKNFKNNHRHQIPTEFDLQLKDTDSYKGIPINVDIQMKTSDIQYSRIFIIHYWRYHVKTSGTISVGSTTETLHDKQQIIEFLSFKS